MFIYILIMSYTFKLKSAFGNQKCAPKNIKSALFLFTAPFPFFSLRKTLLKVVKSFKKSVSRGFWYLLHAKVV